MAGTQFAPFFSFFYLVVSGPPFLRRLRLFSSNLFLGSSHLFRVYDLAWMAIVRSGTSGSFSHERECKQMVEGCGVMSVRG
jgi:hypothetical protein